MKRKLLMIGGGIIFLVLLALLFLKAASGARYRFVELRHGEPRTAVGPTNIDVYSFTDPAADVLRDMKEELTASGWRLAYEDDVAVIFSKLGEIAEFRYYQPAWSDRLVGGNDEATATKCLVRLPRRGSWISKLPSFLAKWLDPIPKGRKFTPNLQLGRIDLVCKALDPTHVEVLWRNRTEDTVEASVTDLQIKGYDAMRLPGMIKVRPFSSSKVGVEMPSQASVEPGIIFAVNDGTFVQLSGGNEIGYEIRSPRINSGMEISGAQPTEGFERVGSHYEVVFENVNARTLELKNVVIKVNGSPRVKLPPLVKLLPDKPLHIRIPLGKFPSNSPPDISTEGSVRQVPNIRWRPISSMMSY